MKLLIFFLIMGLIAFFVASLVYLIINDDYEDKDPRGTENEDHWDMEKK